MYSWHVLIASGPITLASLRLVSDLPPSVSIRSLRFAYRKGANESDTSCLLCQLSILRVNLQSTRPWLIDYSLYTMQLIENSR